MYRIANVSNRIGLLRRTWPGVALSIAICVLPETSHALGDPVIVYWFAAALLLDIFCLVAIFLRRSSKTAYVVTIFMITCTVLWIVILGNSTLSVHVSGAVLSMFPIFFFCLFAVASMENRK